LPALFALDQNFPEPIWRALDKYILEAELVPLREIDPLLVVDMEDWEVLLALHHHNRPWDGLISADSGILNLPRELAALRQTNLTLVVAAEAGHDPIRATGLLFTHLSWIAGQTTAGEPQVFRLRANNRPALDPWTLLERIADHSNRHVDDVWREAQLTASELAVDPLAL
jgi:UDP:flavonoid glycosyltransferase YjiC (YdhE family)